MPAVVAAPDTAGTPIVATLTSPESPATAFVPTLESLPMLAPMPPMIVPRDPSDATLRSATESRPVMHTALPGISINPAVTVIDEPFSPVGRISSRIGNGRSEYGLDVADKMKTRFPEAASRTSTAVGSMSVLYPTRAAAEGRSQDLSALLIIDAAGKVTEVRVMPNDPPFAAAVIAALKGARFTPAERAGKPVPYWLVMDFRFSIDGPTGPRGEPLNR
jgi:hypothetical protein